MIVYVLLAVVHCVTAALPVFKNEDPLLIAVDHMGDYMYEVPEYEDPQAIDQQISSLSGGLPMISLLDLARKYAEPKEKDTSQKIKIDTSMKALEDIIYRLETTRSKLENGNSNVYIDLEKSIQGLKKLERNFRPDIRAFFSSHRNLKPVSDPVALPNIMEIVTTTRTPALYDKSSIIEMPEKYEKKIIDVKVISKEKSVLDQSTVDEEPAKEKKLIDFKIISKGKPILDQPRVDEEPANEKKIINVKVISKEKSIPEQSLDDKKPANEFKIVDQMAERDNEYPAPNLANVETPADISTGVPEFTTAAPHDQEYKIRGRKIYDTPSRYQSQWTWENGSSRLSS